MNAVGPITVGDNSKLFSSTGGKSPVSPSSECGAAYTATLGRTEDELKDSELN